MRRVLRAVRAIPSNTPLRMQLIMAVLLLVAAGLIISNFAGVASLRGYLLSKVDAQLVDTARDTFRSGQVAFDGDEPYFSYRDQGPMLSGSFFTELSDTAGTGHAQLRTPYGSTQTAPKLPSLKMPLAHDVNGRTITVPPVGAGSDWRVLVTSFPDGSGSLTVGTTLTDVNSTVARLRFIDLIVSCIVLGLLGLIGSFVVHQSLRRLSQVEETADAISHGDLSKRAPEWSTNTEVGRMAHSFNLMLGRIEDAFSKQRQSEEEARASEERMRQFVADASHELRTPLTSIRGFAELRRQGAAGSPELVDHSFERIESEAQRMTLLVEDLLLLARLDQQRPLGQEPVDLSVIVHDVVQAAPVIAPGHVVEASVDDSGPLMVLGDEARLHQVLVNLVNNAYTHTPNGTHVWVTLRSTGQNAVFEVRDDGPGMTSEEASRVFERFYRADPARSRAQGGSGLGLSIVAGIVTAHHGTVTVASAPGEGATFTVTLPLLKMSEESQLAAEN